MKRELAITWLRRRPVLARLTMVAVSAVLVGPWLGPSGARGSTEPTTFVTISFDDGFVDQLAAAALMTENGMRATFWINSGTVGASAKYMTWAQLHGLADDGHEVAGHTVLHESLPEVSLAEQRREICLDRSNLIDRGFTRVTDFAYPYGAWTGRTNEIAASCGYRAARTNESFGRGVYAERVPPTSLYRLHTPPGVVASTSLAKIESRVAAAESHGGGWIEIRLHHVCDGCDPLAITPDAFERLVVWLGAREGRGTAVRTVQEVFGTAPPVGEDAAPVSAPSVDGPRRVLNASLERASNGNDPPDCFEFGQFGINTSAWRRSSPGHTGRYAERLTLTRARTGAAYMIQKLDLGDCAPAVVAATAYRLSVWYTASKPVRMPVYVRSGDGSWRYWTTSPSFPATARWKKASFLTDPLPPDATGVSFGLALETAGWLATDDYDLSVAPVVSAFAATSRLVD